MDRLLSSYSDKLKDDYDKEWEKENDNWGIKLCRRFTQAVTLLMFCLGYQVGALMNVKRGEPLFSIRPKEEEPGYFAVAVAGRGSLMWDWLKDCEDSHLCEFFEEGVSAAGAQWPDVDIRIVRDNDPTETVGRGMLSNPRNLDASDGWGDLPNTDRLNEAMEDASYYYKAMKRFLSRYAATLHDPMLPHILDVNALHGYAQHSKATLNDAFKILMEVLYSVLEKWT